MNHIISAPPLEGKLAKWMNTAISNENILKNWINLYNSPLHITELSEFRKNILDMKKTLQSRNLEGDIFFARKANKLPWFVKVAKECDIGVDTASLQELDETLRLGLNPEKIVVTAIGKDELLISRSIETGSLLILDNYDEFNLVESTAKILNKKARIGLRFSGFTTENRVVFSRFGFPIKDAYELIIKIWNSPYMDLEIFHAHIDKYETAERASAAFEMISIIDELKVTKGIEVKGIDLGGGILMNYLEKKEQWNEYQKQLKDSILGYRTPFNINNDGLGLKKVGEKLEGELELYPFWNNNAKVKFIENILDKKNDMGEPLYKALSKRNLKLFFEPGRSLLDNTGITLARVAFRKRDTENNMIIGLSMNRMNIRPFRAEFCVDPIHLSYNEVMPFNEGAYIVGCLCSESDLIYKRKIQLDRIPNIGDIYLFPNTAGYLAHHMEIGTHGNPLPNNILIDSNSFEVLDTI